MSLHVDTKIPRGYIEREGLMEIISQMRDKLALLQQYCDSHGETWIKGIAITTAADASEAVEVYDQDWFAAQLFSLEVKCKIARALLEAIKPFPYINTDTWDRISKGFNPEPVQETASLLEVAHNLVGKK